VWIGNGTLETNGTFTSSRRVVLAPGAGLFVNSGTWTQNGTFEGALSKGGAGTLELGGGGTQALVGVRVQEGTLLLSRNSSASVHAIGAGGGVDLRIESGGKVALGGTGGDQIHSAA